MTEHHRIEDVTEPQSIDELVRETYRGVKAIENVVFGRDGLCNRMTVQETIISVLSWVVGIGIPALGVVVGWILFFKHP